MLKETFIKNRENYLSNVSDSSLTVLFAGEPIHLSADEYYPFQVNKNFYYLTGLKREKFVLVLQKGNNKTRTLLFIEKEDPYMALWVGERMKREEASRISGIEEDCIFYLESFKNMLHQMISGGRGNSFSRPQKIYFDLEKESYDSFYSQTDFFVKDFSEKYPYLKIDNAYSIISNLRMIKNDEEIKELKKAIDITDKGIRALMMNAHPNMTEYELESYFDQVLKFHNTSASFKTIAASGVNATVLHYSTNDTKIDDESLILFDLGALSNMYSADITRTFPINGKFTERQKQIYEIVLKCNKESIKFIKPGITWKEYNEFGEKILAEGLMEIGLIKEPKELRKYYYHSLGHSLGLDTHDVGEYVLPFRPGMVLTCEPGLYIKEEGIGIRIEDDVLVTEDGSINLSSQIIKEIDDIEQFFTSMQK